MRQIKKLQTFNNRYIGNKFFYIDNIPDLEKEIKPQLENHLTGLIKSQLKYSHPNLKYTINSEWQKEYNFSLYSGTGSNTYIFWRYHLLARNKYRDSSEYSESLELFKNAIEINLELVKSHESSKHFSFLKNSPSFYMGPAGIYTMACIYYSLTQDKENFVSSLQNLFKYDEIIASNKNKFENELLYGNTGYLFSLLLLKKNCKEFLEGEYMKRLNDSILFMIRFIFNQGVINMKNLNSEFLIWPWPKDKVKKLKDVYLGGAHGVIGVYFILLEAVKNLGLNHSTDLDNLNSTVQEEFKNILEMIKLSLDKLSDLRFESGNFPSRLGKDVDNLVHFCHGEVGAVILYLSAYKFFKDDSYLQVAISSGEDIWKRGLLLKGNGVCHGISGNAYSLYSLYKYTSNTIWKNRALLFAYATVDEEIQNLCSEHDDPQRVVVGSPDSPFSLMEGQGGQICLLCDMLNDGDDKIFPGYEI